MKRQVVWHLIGLATVFLAGTGGAGAGIPAQETVCWLGTGDWELTEKDGEVCLVEAHWGPNKRPLRSPDLWQVSAPTIKGRGGKYLGGDPEGRRPSVHLLADKGPTTRWVFEIVSTLRPGPSREGPSGFTFRAKMAEGPYKGWYLAIEGEGRARRRLQLVRDKEATVFTYIEKNYFTR